MVDNTFSDTQRAAVSARNSKISTVITRIPTIVHEVPVEIID